MTTKERLYEELKNTKAPRFYMENGMQHYVDEKDPAFNAWAEALEKYETAPCESLKDYRMTRHMSQQAVADRSGMGLRAYQKYESGETKLANMTLKYAIGLAKALSLDLEDLEELMHVND